MMADRHGMAVRPKGATHHVATAVVKVEDAADAADVVAGEIAANVATVLARVRANVSMRMRCLLAATPTWLPDHPRCPLAMHPAMTSNGRNVRHATVSAVAAAVVTQNAPKAVNARRARTATRTAPSPATRGVGTAAPNPESRVSHANHARGAQNVGPTAGRARTRVRQPCQQQPKPLRPIQLQSANRPMPLQCKTPRPNGSKVQRGVMPVRANARDANAARAMTAHAVMATRKGHR
jgi:hypothetical protein